jgi:hypothetical protein
VACNGRTKGCRDAGEIERAIAAFAREGNSGLIVLSGGLAISHRGLIMTLAARHRLPAVYPFRYFVAEGGLMSYGPDTIDPYRRAAGYVDRILKGEKPADLPVQAPTKYETVINLKTARALGLTIPETLLATADEVIQWRREFIAGLGSAAVWPLAARAQQPAMLVIGSLNPGTPEADLNFAAAFRAGLSETGFVEGRNIAIERRFALNDYGRLQDLRRWRA